MIGPLMRWLLNGTAQSREKKLLHVKINLDIVLSAIAAMLFPTHSFLGECQHVFNILL